MHGFTRLGIAGEPLVVQLFLALFLELLLLIFLAIDGVLVAMDALMVQVHRRQVALRSQRVPCQGSIA